MMCKCGKGEFLTKRVEDSRVWNEGKQQIKEIYTVRIRKFLCCNDVKRFIPRPKYRQRKGLKNEAPEITPILNIVLNDLNKRKSTKVRYIPLVRRLKKELQIDTQFIDELETLCNCGLIIIEERPNPKIKLHTKWEIAYFTLTEYGKQFCHERYPSKEDEVIKIRGELSKELIEKISVFENNYRAIGESDPRYTNLREPLKNLQRCLNKGNDCILNINKDKVSLNDSPKRFLIITKILLELMSSILKAEITDTTQFCNGANISTYEFNRYKRNVEKIAKGEILLFGVFKSYPTDIDAKRAEELRTYFTKFEKNIKKYIVDRLFDCYGTSQRAWNTGFKKVNKKCENRLKKEMKDRGLNEKEIERKIITMKINKEGLNELFKKGLFSDIKIVITETEENWNRVFKPIFGQNRNKLRRNLDIIIELRNSVSHGGFEKILLFDGLRILYELHLIIR